jgi:lambda family phage portal protein
MEGSITLVRASLSPLDSSRLSLHEAARYDGYADGWTTRSVGAADETDEIEKIVARVRDLVRNGSLTPTIVEVLTNRIVQPGINLSIQGKGSSYERIRDLVYEQFFESTDLDYDGESSFQTLLAQMVSETVIGGGCIALRIFDKTAPLGFRIKQVEQGFIARSYSQQGGGTRRGIEYDSKSRKLAYLLQSHDASAEGLLGKRKLLRYKIEDLAHYYIPTRIGAEIGLPWVSSLVAEIRVLEDFIYNTHIRNRNAAAISTFIETNERAYGGASHSPGSSQFQEDDEEGGDSPETDDRGFVHLRGQKKLQRSVTRDEYVEQFSDLRPGTNYLLRFGEKISHPQIPDPPDFAGFHKPRLQAIARATGGASYEDISGDFSNSSFSAARMSESQPRIWVQKRREQLRGKVLSKIWRWTLEGLQLKGYDTSGIWHRWEMLDPPPINPKEEMLLAESQVNLASSSRSEFIRRSGRDPDVVFNEIAEERRKMAELGILPGVEPKP